MSKSHLIVPKPILQIVLLMAGSALCLAPPLPAQSVTGQGTAGKIAKFTGASTIGNSAITESSTRIGIGTNTPASKLTVIANNSANATILGRNTGSGPGVSGTSTNGSPGVSGTAAQGTGVIGNGILGVYGQGNNGGSGVYGNSSAGVGVYGNSVNSDAVYGNSTNGIGVHGVGSQAGVHGEGNGYGVLAQGGSYGVAAYGSVGIYAAPTSGNTVAGLFGGNVQINGNLTKSSGSFKIDHPLDPANKYLLHSFVVSPDMKNIYDGTITLDERGEAVVPMPDYFSALNQDFRYQLTAIGAPAPGLYVAQKMTDNHFRIAGGKAGVEVSWQVTGVRHDAYAKDHRIAVEEDKGKERGYYLYPAGFSEPREKSVESFALRKQSDSDVRTVSSR